MKRGSIRTTNDPHQLVAFGTEIQSSDTYLEGGGGEGQTIGLSDEDGSSRVVDGGLVGWRWGEGEGDGGGGASEGEVDGLLLRGGSGLGRSGFGLPAGFVPALVGGEVGRAGEDLVALAAPAREKRA